MPIYEYRCDQCGAEFERICPMSQADKPGPCPQCGSLAVQRCLSLFAAVSRGSGETRPIAGGSECSSCSSSSCATCGKG